MAQGTEQTPDGARVLALGIVVLTVAAGTLDIVQRLRGGDNWPVALVIYLTLLPVMTFVLLQSKEASLPASYLVAIFAPLPIILALLFLRRR